MDDQILLQLKTANYYTSRIYSDIHNSATSSQDIVAGLNQIAKGVDSLNTNFNTYQSNFTNQPWFQFLLGSLVTFLVTWLYDYKKLRAKELESWYEHLTDQYVFHTPDALLEIALMTSYASTSTTNGIITITLEKPIAERMVIRLRSELKWWNLPHGQLRYLFYQYEKSLSNIPDINSRRLIEESKEYNKSLKRYEKLKLHIFRVTGENQWTA